jgi:CubicO group peptidase (beta-lactamase class C family)
VDTQRVDAVLQSAVDAGDVFGVAATVADRNGPVYEGAFGWRRADSDERIEADTMFRVASMTKAVTSVAAVQLAEAGKLNLDAPVGSIVPSWRDLKVLEGFDGDVPRLRDPSREATVRELLTHTAGLSYWIWNADTTRYEELTGQLNVLSGANACFANPLVRDPGERFEYSMAADWVGRVVESVSGESLDQYFHAHIFDPLGMKEITVKMSGEQRARSVPVHVRTPEGGFMATDVDWNQEPEFWAGGHCLYSTPGDYQRFQRMLLAGGELDGTRILEAGSVDQMFTNQIGDLDVQPLPELHADLSLAVDLGEGLKWGLGLLLNPEPVAGMRAAGSGAWAGLLNTHFWVDRASGITGAIFMQLLPFFDPKANQVYADFERAVYAG